jgi:hypothetical protein
VLNNEATVHEITMMSKTHSWLPWVHKPSIQMLVDGSCSPLDTMACRMAPITDAFIQLKEHDPDVDETDAWAVQKSQHVYNTPCVCEDTICFHGLCTLKAIAYDVLILANNTDFIKWTYRDYFGYRLKSLPKFSLLQNHHDINPLKHYSFTSDDKSASNC